uniref:PD-(D/E)XK endonuclease-like domain-containing protein n=1 Tax=Neobodo designis TaxID=312471 RepID=A0A7S1MMB8_NEODS|eukprot:CAMPEP_0174829458 /NCGR_PEP_ID=MMETSP1114-20130205/1940_1 /TAXON_ID=312471 /ORGANISM="Neobodo designis, Strain CCAP 1951/1" /LENGTH=275 /DNA_ID=CAMNT_0016063207 /DNA_START=38 /DNA_END=865 /DNA_ORIENTATION=+
MASAIKKVPHPSGKVVFFNPARHVYSIGAPGSPGARCRSVSSILNQFFPFDADKVSKIVATKQEKTQQAVLDEWKMSAQLGTNVHSHIEALLLKQPPPKFAVRQGNEEKFLPVATAAVERVQADYEIIAVETIVVSERFQLAGTIDFLAKNRKTGAVMVGDWKTTSSVATGFKFSSFEGPCPPPVSHLPNSKLTRYALQTMLYGHILRTEGYASLIDDGIATMPLEYGLVRFGPNERGEVVADFTRVCESDLHGVDDAADLPSTTLIERICAMTK